MDPQVLKAMETKADTPMAGGGKSMRKNSGFDIDDLTKMFGVATKLNKRTSERARKQVVQFVPELRAAKESKKERVDVLKRKIERGDEKAAIEAESIQLAAVDAAQKKLEAEMKMLEELRVFIATARARVAEHAQAMQEGGAKKRKAAASKRKSA